VPAWLLIAATAGLEEVQVTESVRLWVLPSLKVPVAVKGWVAPSAMLDVAGVTKMLINAAEPTVKVVVAVCCPSLAPTDVFPKPALVARPWLPVALLITAIELDVVPQVTSSVMSEVDPSL
jgi:hypothetical protein